MANWHGWRAPITRWSAPWPPRPKPSGGWRNGNGSWRLVGYRRHLAHEINNPLGGLLNADGHDPQLCRPSRRGAQSADLLDRGLRHLRDVTRATLDQNRIDAETRMLTPDDFEDIKLLIQPEVSRLALDLEWSVDPSAVTGCSVTAGPVRQIALNLLLNACAAAGQSGRVGLIACSRDDNLILQITNTGSAMPKAAHWTVCLMTAPSRPEAASGCAWSASSQRKWGAPSIMRMKTA